MLADSVGRVALGAAVVSEWKRDDGYEAIVARLNDRWRVIACHTNLQWILQKAKRTRHGVAWQGRSYCRTQRALLRVCGEYAGRIDPAAMAVLEGLPALFLKAAQ